MCTKFHWSLFKNNWITEVWNFFYKSTFRLVGLDGKIIDLPHWNFSGWYRGVKLTAWAKNFTIVYMHILYIKNQLIEFKFIAKLVIYVNFHTVTIASFVTRYCTWWRVLNTKCVIKKTQLFTEINLARGNPQYTPFITH